MAPSPVLRVFEKRLLEALGFGLDFSGLDANAHYQFRPTEGVREASPDQPDCLSGHSLLELASEKIESVRALDDARRLLRSAIDHCLEGRQLATRGVARAIVREVRA